MTVFSMSRTITRLADDPGSGQWEAGRFQPGRGKTAWLRAHRSLEDEQVQRRPPC
jgi:hypothetical protein